MAARTAHSQVGVPAGGGVFELRADQQRMEGKVFYADGDVDIRYANLRLRADHVEYDTDTGAAAARGHVQFAFDSQHLEAEAAHYNLRTGRGEFRHVRGAIQAQRRPNPNVLLSPNPLSFEAEEVDRLNERTYAIRHAWVTVCAPDRPKWKFYAPRATIRLERSVRLVNANFRLFDVPVLYLPIATTPAGRKVRQSGFLVPDSGHTSRKGFVVGDSFYFAPVDWADATFGAQLLSRRGWSQIAEVRLRPGEDVHVAGSYFGVSDRGLSGRPPQGGHESHWGLDALLPNGWHAVADLNQLTSLTFRLAFAETFAQAVNSEVRTTGFLTKNFRGFSLNFAAVNYKNFLSVMPETAVLLRTAPEVRFSSVEQAPWKRWPIYFGFHAFADAVHRSQPSFNAQPALGTAAAVQRSELAPQVSIPVRWGRWLGVTPTFLARTTRYGSQLQNNIVVGEALRRTTAELTVDLRPPSLARVWERPEAKWKHAIEPRIVYRYVNGVNRFGRFLRFDEDDTLTDTNEFEYSLTQRVFRRGSDGSAAELLSWRVTQKYYFDPTFGGAVVPGQRNVFQALNSVTPFAFADAPRRFSPIVSDLRVTPGGRYDAQFRVDYDPVRSKVTALGTVVKMRPYRDAFITLAHFSTRASNILQPRSNQVRALVGYGEINREGWNAAFGFSYDAHKQFLQNQLIQVSYNGTCCGIAFEFRRLALGPVRSENQFRVALLIANLGTFGNLRRQEKIF